MNDDGELSGFSEDEESEDEDGEEEEAGSEDEIENGENKEEGEESTSSAALPPVEKVGFSSLFFSPAAFFQSVCLFDGLCISVEITTIYYCVDISIY